LGLGLLWAGQAVGADEPLLPPMPEPVTISAPAKAADQPAAADKLPDVTIPRSPRPAAPFRKQSVSTISTVYIPPPPPPVPQVHEANEELPAAVLPITVAKAQAAPTPVVQRLGAPETLDAIPVPAAHRQTALVLPDLSARTSPSAIQLCLQVEQPERRPPTTRPEEPRGASEEIEPGYRIQLEPPGKERVFQLEGEAALKERLRQEARQRPTHERIDFPDEPPVSTQRYAPRAFPPMVEVAEPHYVCYRRLLFEDLNSERYGWDLGFIQPFVSAGAFYWDLATLPYHLGTEPCRKYECSAGYCLPGDPVPYLLYPPELSLTGTVFEAGTIVALFAIFPG